MGTPRKKKPAYVEWDITGNEASGFGAVIYRSAVPMAVIKEIPADHRSGDEVAAAVEQWVSSVPDQYRLNEEFERFKATVRRLEAEGDPGMDDGPGSPLLR